MSRPRLLPLLLVLLLGVSPLDASERQAKEAELKQLRERITALQQRLQKARGQHDALRNELRTTERRIGELNRNIRRLDQDLAERRRRQEKLEGEERSLQETVSAQRDYLAAQVRAAYAMGRQEYLKILLNQQSPSTVGRVVTYYDYLNQARSERITHLSVTINELERVQRELGAEAERLRTLREQRAGEKSALEQGRLEREELVRRLKAEIESEDQRLTGMRRDEEQLKELIRALADALSDIPAEAGNRKPFASLKGKMQWPASGPLLVSYGSPRKLGKLRWSGVMIGAQQGQEVRTISHGRVAFADWLRGYGLLMIIDHGDGYMSLYGHNQSLYKETGDWVEAGETIASVGDSGGLDRVGLYFEIRKNGRPTDPVRWCRR
ncbi:MAG: peptidoglycan DD-metalloendopeptidase family protein [Gammaproteobacteria bacterium]|nr:peptidoglycan DD-metalloendopeptidase family protein [Gammaproteobacteria bacterium]MCW8841448.1 peptidoglycan DD-metalloendopeptidase family protein [Gammaproteobacteria bacterium]MCW8927717.1 peptidoglycan DD-metalloendopeptidase family protein [Gammaproteobacteria bacterium]MCW8958641.1 peptidoglycan DD-metalloendopeptidase family protein [Gammaproteobacteria bacterium]MCW8971985.1 peptidoglycan DD-metalloendopeptidase family protein [Gammaproteobacteria bacterium]